MKRTNKKTKGRTSGTPQVVIEVTKDDYRREIRSGISAEHALHPGQGMADSKHDIQTLKPQLLFRVLKLEPITEQFPLLQNNHCGCSSAQRS